ncbi:AMP-dependent ligase [Cupriavidus taiwanensis]|uniref:acyl-CoA synthetase n=1 Tax=Cupriavidus taiwanensis TaxID=164546 RepID=UPI000E19F5BD|nr:acyl-CoA synthetase [Cupriavidus taiwanensis]SOZ99791.1 AMP-dependent ligase [Cupriavidus taiwanensis]
MSSRQPVYWTSEVLRSEEDVARFERTPLSDRHLPKSTHEMLMDGCSIDPLKVAIQFFSDGVHPRETSVSITFGELRQRILQTANLLTELGIEKNDVTSVLMPAVPEGLYALWGAQAAGIANPVNWMLEADILVEMFKVAGTRVLIAYAGDESTNIWSKIEAVAKELPSLSAVIRVGGSSDQSTSIGSVPVIDFGTAIARQPGDRLVSDREFSPDDVAALFHTGGTTGVPKLAKHLHRNQVFWIWASSCLTGFGREEVRAVGVPIFHSAGAIVSCLAPLSRGASIVLMTSAGFRHPSVLPNIWRIVEAFRISMLTLVPTLVNQVLSLPIGASDVSSLNYVASSTAPLSTNVAEAFYRMTGLRIRESYGLTETAAVTCITPPVDKVKVGSSGLRLPYQSVRVIQAGSEKGTARDCAPGEAGLIIVKGPAVFPGYLGAEQSASWVDGEWLDTGDLGYLDEDNWLWITGRAKDLIIRGGHNIDPKMVEEVLFANPAIQDAAVIGAPDAHSGEVPVAYVVLKPGSEASTEELLQYAAKHVPERAAVPKQCYLLPQMPKTAVGKIQKNLLRVDAIERIFDAALSDASWRATATVKAIDRGARGFLVEIHIKGKLPDDMDTDQRLRALTIPYEIRQEA